MKNIRSLTVAAGWLLVATRHAGKKTRPPPPIRPWLTTARPTTTLPTLPAATRKNPTRARSLTPTDSRITLEITAESSFLPNTEVTLKVSGEAQEEITGGTVILTLPTKATMDHAGVGKPPYYPQGEEMPVTASWELPAMDAGDTWEKTVTIPAAVAGY